MGALLLDAILNVTELLEHLVQVAVGRVFEHEVELLGVLEGVV